MIHPRRLRILAALFALPVFSASAAPMVGVNLAGAEFGSTFPGVYGTNYTYPTATELDYYRGRGVMLIRLPIRWERIQPTMNAGLDPSEFARLDAVVNMARDRGMRIVIDLHNYGRRFVSGTEYVIGTAQVPRSAYKDLWTRLAACLGGYDCIWAYGIMNEPHDLGAHTWKDTAQQAIDGIRSQDLKKTILVAGDGWSGAHSWTAHNAGLHTLFDPSNNLVFEAHQYFDNDSSGAYDAGNDTEGATASTGVTRLAPFVNWCVANNVRGFVGEMGVPDNDPRWITTLDNAIAYLQANDMSATLWAGGPWWGGYALSTEMRASHDEAAQMASVIPYGRARGTRHWKPFTWYHDAVATGVVSSYAYDYKSAGATLSANFADTAVKYAGGKGITLGYTVPPGNYAGAGMQITGGVDLGGNVANGQVVTFMAKGTAGSSLNVFFVTQDGVSTTKVDTGGHVTLNTSSWQRVSLPLSAFLTAGFDGSQRVKRLVFECRPADGVARVVHVDQVEIRKPDETAPTVSIDTAGGVASFPTGASITVNATAADAGGIDFVEFWVNGSRYHEDTAAPYTHTFSLGGPGSYRLTAVAYDNHGNARRSLPKVVTVDPKGSRRSEGVRRSEGRRSEGASIRRGQAVKRQIRAGVGSPTC